MLISNRTDKVLAPIAANWSWSISPVGIAFIGDGDVGGTKAKSRGIGGKFFVFAGDSGRVSPDASFACVASGLMVCALDDTLYIEELLLAVLVKSAVFGVIGSLSCLGFVPFDSVYVLSLSLSLPLIANESFDAFLVKDRRTPDSWPDRRELFNWSL